MSSTASALASAPPSSPATRSRGKRTRTGCLTCRARKIKCDEGSGVCANCSRASLECVRSSNSSLPQATRVELAMSAETSRRLTQAGLQRRRTKRSCSTCKVVKKRCDGGRPQCGRCIKKGLRCVYNEEREGTLIAQPPPASIFNGPLSDEYFVRKLCEVFFDEIAPLRCFSFLHRHTFLEDLKNRSAADDALLLSVCALATKTIQMREHWDLGCGWARSAQRLIFDDIEDISVHRLMSILLLHEHAARVGEQRLCFMLSGMASRYTQALSLNLEYEHDVMAISTIVTPVERESRRRLMWCSWIMDTLLACGVNHLQVVDASTIRIQLPCDDRYFLYKMPCVTAVPKYSNISRERDTELVSTNQGISAFMIRLYLIRESILQYSNNCMNEADAWRLTSSLADLEQWNEALPAELQFNSNVIAIRKEQSMLSALVALHISYHQVNCMLYRCTIPSMLFPARMETSLSVRASHGFLTESRKGWFDHACAMSTIFEVALEHRPMSMTDPSLASSAYNAIIIKFLYITNFVDAENRLSLLDQVMPLVDIDLRFLQELHGYHPCVRFTCSAAEQLVEEAKTNIVLDPTVTLSESRVHQANLGFPTDLLSLDTRMNRLSAFAQMRRKLPDLHAPDRAPGSLDPGTPTNQNEGLWMWR